MTGHTIAAYTTHDGVGIRCTCGASWEWNADSTFTLDDMAAQAREHIDTAQDADTTTCRHCGADGEDTGGRCPRCERHRDTGRPMPDTPAPVPLCACGHPSGPYRHGDCHGCAVVNNS